MAGITQGTRSRTTVPFHGEFLHSEYHLVRVGGRLDAATIPTQGSVTVTVGTGGAAAGATTVPVTALSGPLAAGIVLDFGGAKFARLTAAAAAGATTLTVAALPVALAAGDVATFVGSGRKTVLAGTLVGRVRATETLFGPYATGDTEFYLTAFTVQDAAADPDVELIVTGKNFTVVPERLPNWAALPTAQQTLVFDHYKTIKVGAE